jgi:serine/threonine protein kinase
MLEVAEGVQYIHSEGVVHGDLHGVRASMSNIPESQGTHIIVYQGNVLLDSELRCKITDFGLARHAEATFTRSTRTFLPNFAAPELFGMCTKCGEPECGGCYEGPDEHHTGKTMETDVYAFGCLYYAVRLTYSLISLLQPIER